MCSGSEEGLYVRLIDNSRLESNKEEEDSGLNHIYVQGSGVVKFKHLSCISETSNIQVFEL